MSRLTKHIIETIVGLALKEDLPFDDITTGALIKEDTPVDALIHAKEDLVLAGLICVACTFYMVDPGISISFDARDGDVLRPGEAICHLKGNASAILKGERVALNFLQHLSGIATLTHRFVQAVEGTGVRICDTRKTTPGLRGLEKYAVRVGGGFNHRYSLSDGVLIKDNHIKACGGIKEAIKQAKIEVPHLCRVEIEVTSLEEFMEALENGADIILLDNMDMGDMKKAVSIRDRGYPWVLLEASGGINMDNVKEVALTGVDVISIGGLTHSAGAVDISLDFI